MRESKKSAGADEKAECHESHKSGKSGWMNYALLAGIGVLLVMGFTQAIQIGGFQAKIGPGGTGTASLAAASGSGAETNGQMMARMHPDQVQSAQTAQSSGVAAPSGRQVGGC